MSSVQGINKLLTLLILLTASGFFCHPTSVAARNPAFPASENQAPNDQRIVIERLGLLPHISSPPVCSDDGRHVAYVTTLQPGREAVAVDAKPGPAYVRIAKPSLGFSPDGQHIAYVARTGEKQSVVVDHKAIATYDGICTQPMFLSYDGTRMAYVAGKNDKKLVVIAEEEGPPYDAIYTKPVLSPDGSRAAYAAKRAGRWFFVVDGKERPGYDGVMEGVPVFSPDARRVALVAKRGGKESVVLDGKEGPPYDAVVRSSLLFGPRGSRFAYVARSEGQWIVVVDGKEYPAYDGVVKGTLVFSPCGRHIAYAAQDQAPDLPPVVHMVFDGKRRGAWTQVSAPFFGPHGEHFGYTALNGLMSVAWVDGDPAGPPIVDDPKTPRQGIVPRLFFSPDGSRVAYIVSDGKKKRVVLSGGEEGPMYTHILPETVEFSPDGERVAYVAVKGGGPCKVGGHMAIAMGETAKLVAVVDGEEGPLFKAILIKGPTFDEQGALEYLACKGDVLYRVKHRHVKSKGKARSSQNDTDDS